MQSDESLDSAYVQAEMFEEFRDEMMEQKEVIGQTLKEMQLKQDALYDENVRMLS
jgi:hypothetical protein